VTVDESKANEAVALLRRLLQAGCGATERFGET
jgi:hypothetical protein